MHAVYLHGFASSGQSSKGAYFASKLKPYGVTLYAPDFNEPDFHSMTITRMLQQTARAIEDSGDEHVVLIGSSLGGFVAVQAAMAWPARVAKLVLLAPALDLRAERMSELGDRALAEWKSSGETMVFHYAYGRIMPIGYGLYEDARQYDSMNATVPMPIQIFQGLRDTAVSPAVVKEWSAARPNVELHMLDDDHQLLGSLDHIFARMSAFLNLL